MKHLRAHVKYSYCMSAHQGVTPVGSGQGRVTLDRDSGRELAPRRGPPAFSSAAVPCGGRWSNAIAAVQRLFGDRVGGARQKLPDAIQFELLAR